MAASKERTKGIHQWWHLIDLAEALVERMTPWNTKYKLVSWRAFASSAWIRFSCFSLICMSFISLWSGLLLFPGSWSWLFMLTLCLSLSITHKHKHNEILKGAMHGKLFFIAKLSYDFRHHQNWWVGQKEWSNLIQ